MSSAPRIASLGRLAFALVAAGVPTSQLRESFAAVIAGADPTAADRAVDGPPATTTKPSFAAMSVKLCQIVGDRDAAGQHSRTALHVRSVWDRTAVGLAVGRSPTSSIPPSFAAFVARSCRIAVERAAREQPAKTAIAHRSAPASCRVVALAAAMLRRGRDNFALTYASVCRTAQVPTASGPRRPELRAPIAASARHCLLAPGVAAARRAKPRRHCARIARVSASWRRSLRLTRSSPSWWDSSTTAGKVAPDPRSRGSSASRTRRDRS